MRKLAWIMFALLVAAPAGAVQELDGSAWQLRCGGLFSPHDRVTFWKGRFICHSSVRAGGKPVEYDCRRQGDAVLWSARESEPTGGVRLWEGVWDARTAVMRGHYIYQTADGRMEARDWQARRYKE